MNTRDYEEIRFESRPGPERHPDRFGVIGRLFGVETPDPERMRVLEIGCGTGANLLPVALQYPQARVVGIDASASQIKTGLDDIEELGIGNVTLEARDVASLLEEEVREFDFIICHGVFSWVDEATRSAIFEICRRSLSPDGIAYVSYNLLPGWAVRGEIRERLLDADDPAATASERVGVARTLLEEWEFSLRNDFRNQAVRLKEELRQCIQQTDSFIFHELLARSSRPFFFSEFLSLASQYGLEYLGEALPQRMCDPSNENGEAGNRTELEQEADHRRAASFRGTLLCRAANVSALELRPTALQSLWCASPLVPRSDMPDIHTDALVEFVSPRGDAIKVGEPLIKAALIYMRGLWPMPVPFREVLDSAVALSGDDSSPDEREQALTKFFLQRFFRGELFLEGRGGYCEEKVPRRPCVSRFAAIQASRQWWVTNLRHEYVPLGMFERHLIQYTDGSRTVDEIRATLSKLVADGALELKEGGESVSSTERGETLIATAIAEGLAAFAEFALLQSEDARRAEQDVCQQTRGPAQMDRTND